jgi:ribosomal protein S12 methylthiotransferase accessory factor
MTAEQAAGLEKLKTFLSPYTGIASAVDEVLNGPAEARMTNIVCEMADRRLTLASSYPMAAASASYDPDAALAAALGEAVERYAGSYVPEGRFVLASADEIGAKAVEPESFSLFHEAQHAQDEFRFSPFTGDTTVCWVKGWRLPDGEEAYLPQQLIYMGYERGGGIGGETQIGVGSSSGLALGVSRESAVLGGLLELVERDAIMLTWLNGVSMPHLDWSADAEMVAHEQRHFAPTGLDYDVLDLSRWSGIPTVLAIHQGERGPVRYVMGGASGTTIQEAWDKAVREMFQGVTLLRFNLRRDPKLTFRDDYSDVMSPEDHSNLYLVPGNEAHAEFLVESDERQAVGDVASVKGGDPAASIEAIMSRLDAINASAYAVEVTTADVAEAGLHVVKTISPELQPIDFVHRERFLGGRRLYQAAFDLGLRDTPLSLDQVNPYPHPFP